MNFGIKFGCFLTGWNTEVLKQCSEASYKHLKKYTSALLILILMWGFTGYCFAERYVHAPVYGCIAAAFVFVMIVIQIERQIILTVGANKSVFVFRMFIAIIMSIIGSSIVDQVIFGKDIERQMVEITDRQVQEQLPMRLNVINSRLAELRENIDSLDRICMQMNKEIAEKPTISVVSTQVTNQPVQGDDGTIKHVSSRSVSTSAIPNPQIEQVKMLDKNLQQMKKQEAEYNLKKLNMESDLRRELSSNVGFLEELKAMFELMSSRTEALIFYIIVFCFLISLELFVVISKLGDSKCDYDLIVEHQLRIREEALIKRSLV